MREAHVCVPEEDQPKDHVLVFGSVHVPPELVRSSPKGGFKAKVAGVAIFRVG